jgi:hypothetical protein
MRNPLKKARGVPGGQRYEILDDFKQPPELGPQLRDFVILQMKLGRNVLRRHPSGLKRWGLEGDDQHIVVYPGRDRGTQVNVRYTNVDDDYQIEFRCFGTPVYDRNVGYRTPQLFCSYLSDGREARAIEHSEQIGNFEQDARIYRINPRSPQALATAIGSSVFERGTVAEGPRMRKISNQRIGQEEFDVLGRYLIGRTIPEALAYYHDGQA